MIAKTNRRNQHGVKHMSDTWRTIGGQHYMHWSLVPDDDRVKLYRAAGVRCRRFGVDIFIHHEDQAAATAVDKKAGN